MTTRVYYLPRNRISIYLLERMIERVGCSIGDIKVLKAENVLKVPITCNDKDMKKVERILLRYDLMET